MGPGSTLSPVATIKQPAAFDNASPAATSCPLLGPTLGHGASFLLPHEAFR